MPYELEPDGHGGVAWRYETVAVLAWQCPSCTSTVWMHDGPPVVEPPGTEAPSVARAPEPPPPLTVIDQLLGPLLGINAIASLVCVGMALRACDASAPISLGWIAGALALFAANYAIDRYRRRRA